LGVVLIALALVANEVAACSRVLRGDVRSDGRQVAVVAPSWINGLLLDRGQCSVGPSTIVTEREIWREPFG